MEWEETKENFVPVKQGRSAAALSTPLSVSKHNSELEDAKRALLDTIEASVDPLPDWLRYIKWTQEQYATHGSKAELQQVLEAATKSLSTSDRYNDDVRLLRIWVQYADCLPDPSDVFLFLEDRGIGRDHALLYEAYATYLELKANYQQADLVFQEGINRLAKPVDRLKQKYATFQERMAKRLQRQTSEQLLGLDPTATSAAALGPARATLAPLEALSAPQLDENGQPIRQSRQQQRQQRMLQQQAAAAASSVAAGVRTAPAAAANSSANSSSRQHAGLWAAPPASAAASAAAPPSLFPLPGNSVSSSSSSKNAGQFPAAAASGGSNGTKLFEVLEDEEFGPSGTGPLPAAFPPSRQQHSQLPGFVASRKENTTDAAAWAGTKLKQAAMFTGPTGSKLEVFEDEESEEQDTAEEQQLQKQHPETIRQKLEGMPAAAAGPLLGSNAPAAAPTASGQLQNAKQPPPQLQQQQRQQQQQQHPVQASSRSRSSGTGSGISRDRAAAAPTDPVAAAAGAAPAPTAAAAGPHGYKESLLIGADGCELSFEEVRAAHWKARRAQQQQQQQQQLAEEQRLQRKQQDAEQQRRREEAQLQIQQQHEQELRRQQQQQQQAAAAAAAAAAEPTVTINTRAALESINCMFSSDLPTMTLPRNAISTAASAAARHGSSRRAVGAAAAGGGGASDPTVTINTRAAFEAMNGMFSTGFGDDTTTMHGFGAAAAAAARGGGSNSGRVAPPAEPTVTINTRAAFDAMNDMFNDVTAHTQTFSGRQMMAASRGGRAAGTSRLSMAAAAGSLGVYEDTELIGGGSTANITGRHGSHRGHSSHRSTAAAAAAAAAAGSGGSGGSAGELLGVYEDTEFVGAKLAAGTAGGAAGGDSRRRSMAMPRCGNDAGTAAAAGEADPGIGIYEDTEFMTSSRMASAAGAAAGQGPSATGFGGGGLGLYEDTEFITRPVGAAAGTAAMAAGGSLLPAAAAAEEGEEEAEDVGMGLGLYEDTEFITRPVGGAGSGAGAGGASTAAAYGIDRLSLANHKSGSSSGSRQQHHHYAGVSGNTENLAPAAAAAAAAVMGASGGLGLYEDTEFITRHIADAPTAAAAGLGPAEEENDLGIYADTEFLTRPVAAAAATTEGGLGNGFGRQRQQQRHVREECSDSTTGLLRVKENLPAAAAGSCGGNELGQQRQQRRVLSAAGGSGSSRLASGSAPGSPQADSTGVHPPCAAATRSAAATPARPTSASAASTPAGQPPRTPGTPWARPMEEFEVMDSPAVRAALAGRPACTALMSPAGSVASPGLGARENSNPDCGDNKAAESSMLPPRSLHDREACSAVLQPISSTRAQLLGVCVEPAVAPGGLMHSISSSDEQQHTGGSAAAAAAGQQQGSSSPALAASGSGRHSYSSLRPSATAGRALRSLKFGGGSEA